MPRSADKSFIESFKTSSYFHKMEAFLEAELVDARDVYESQPASEFHRGQIDMLKNLLQTLRK